MQDHISYTTEHMNSLKALCNEQQSPPEIFVVVSINGSFFLQKIWGSYIAWTYVEIETKKFIICI